MLEKLKYCTTFKQYLTTPSCVFKDDVLMGTLTVRETLYLAAMLRRKQGHTKAETNEKINEILDELGLTKIADNKVCSLMLPRHQPHF